MKLQWLEEYNDPYLKKASGKGALLSGIVLGFVALYQKEEGDSLSDAPLFKKLPFGKLQIRDLKRHLGELPVLLKAYNSEKSIRYQRQLIEISSQATEFLLQDDQELGVSGNFIFTNAFLNARKYFFRLFPELQYEKSIEEKTP